MSYIVLTIDLFLSFPAFGSESPPPNRLRGGPRYLAPVGSFHLSLSFASYAVFFFASRVPKSSPVHSLLCMIRATPQGSFQFSLSFSMFPPIQDPL